MTFADGAPATYGFGLSRGVDRGRAFTGHGGALRGWRSNRVHIPSERLSVVVMLNHLSPAHVALASVVDAVLDQAPAASRPDMDPPGWLGAWLEPETGLSLRAAAAGSCDCETGRRDRGAATAQSAVGERGRGTADGQRHGDGALDDRARGRVATADLDDRAAAPETAARGPPC